MSNYLRAGVSTYGYDSSRLTTAINRGAPDQNCSSQNGTDDRHGAGFSMIFGTHGGGWEDFKGWKEINEKKKKTGRKSKKDFFPHEVERYEKRVETETFNNVSDQLFTATA